MPFQRIIFLQPGAFQLLGALEGARQDELQRWKSPRGALESARLEKLERWEGTLGRWKASVRTN